jgi:hypothetical protein
MKLASFFLFLLLPALGIAGEKLPRVLIIGDFVHQQAVQGVQKDLKGKADVHYPRLDPGIVVSSSSVLEYFDQFVGEGDWDVIHFNVGLGDLIYRAPWMKALRVFPRHAGGIRNTPPEQYKKNLHELVRRLKATNAKLIWASTTPIRHSAADVFEKGSEIEYNAIAAKVMKEHGIPTNDMYAFVTNLIDMDKPAGHGADPFHFDKKPIHPPIMESIQAALGHPKE